MGDFSKDKERPVGKDQDQFLRYVDGEMAPDERTRFQEALTRDRDLEQRFSDYRRTIDMLHGLGQHRAPASFLPGLQRHMLKRRTASPTLRFPYETLLFVLVMTGILYFYAAHMSPSPNILARIVMVELTAPVSPEVVQDFSLTERKDGDRTVALVVRLQEPKVRQLLEKLQPIIKGKVAIPPDSDLYEVILRPPPAPPTGRDSWSAPPGANGGGDRLEPICTQTNCCLTLRLSRRGTTT